MVQGGEPEQRVDRCQSPAEAARATYVVDEDDHRQFPDALSVRLSELLCAFLQHRQRVLAEFGHGKPGRRGAHAHRGPEVSSGIAHGDRHRAHPEFEFLVGERNPVHTSLFDPAPNLR